MLRYSYRLIATMMILVLFTVGTEASEPEDEPADNLLKASTVSSWYAPAMAGLDERCVPRFDPVDPQEITPSPVPNDCAGYQIGIGDVLLISVWKDESLTRQVTVLPDGNISFPLIGEITVNELTVPEVKSKLTDRLARYIPDVTVSAQVIQLNSQVVYILGKVNAPGRLMLTSNINVLQALAIAGGLNPFARGGGIRIFRETSGGTQILPFDYDNVAQGEHLEENIKLQRGDIIVVP